MTTTDELVVAVVDGINHELVGKKYLILEALHRNGRAQTVQDLVHWTQGLDHGLNQREITKTLWVLQKLAYVKFQEHTGSLVKIDLTSKAVRDLWPHERMPKRPVERINRPKKPKIVPATEYKVPEPPRYAKPAPPPQNTKSSTDVESGVPSVRHEVDMQGHAAVSDTHTEYLSDMAVPYKNSPGTATSRQRVLRFLRDVIMAIPGASESNWIGYSELRDKMGMKSGNTSVLVKSASEFSYVDMLSHTGQNLTSFRITDRGREDVMAFGDVLDRKIVKTGKKAPKEEQPFRGHAPGDQSIIDLEEQEAIDQGFSKTSTVKPMEVVARDEADAEKRPIDLTDFPLLVELMSRERRNARYIRAAEILAEDPDDGAADVMLELLEKVQITKVEGEMIRFIKRVINS